jgi:tungstate transport system substrate-binding protein
MFSGKLTKRLVITAAFALVIMLLVALMGCSSGTTKTTTTTTTAAPAATTTTTTALPTTTNTTAAPTSTAPATTTSPAATTTTTKPRTSYNPKEVLLSSTTSVRDTGLMDKLIPLFQSKTGYTVTPVYVGSGAAIALGNTGNADVMVVHQPSGEITFVNSGNGINRKLIMHNDFVLLGPASDPAKVKGTTSAVDAFKALATAAANNKAVTFYSRGDNSGTDAAEKGIFKLVGVTVKDKDPNNPSWYIEASGGMGPLLTIAEQNQGYVFSDRGTYLAYKDKLTLQIVSEGDPAYLNVYHVIEVNPAKFPGIINADGAKAFSDFILGSEAQAIMGTFTDKNGNLLFVPDGGKTDADLGIK